MSHEEEPRDTSELRSFAHLLQKLDDGTVAGDASEELHSLTVALVRHAESHGKGKGSLTLTIDLVCERGGIVDASAKLTTKSPKSTRPKTVLWVGRHGHLTGQNPRQIELGIPRAVPGRKQKVAGDDDE